MTIGMEYIFSPPLAQYRSLVCSEKCIYMRDLDTAISPSVPPPVELDQTTSCLILAHWLHYVKI